MKVCYFTGDRSILKKKLWLDSTRDLYEGSLQKNLGDMKFLYIRTDGEIGFELNHLWITDSDFVSKYIPDYIEYEIRGVEDEKYEVKEFEHWGNN